MCGICGIYNENLEESRRLETVRKMNRAILHRGPDEDGFYSDGNCSLAMRRLSIIDLQGGKQPIFNSDKTVCVFFNGEIYNFRELRDQLKAKGYLFYTKTDTEVLVHLYREYGTQMPKYLKGMFAFCIYDIKKNELFLARDRFGEKPLFYHLENGVFSFSSEIRSLLENPGVPRILNKEALLYHLRTSLIPDPITLFKNIYSLPPGSSMIYSKGKINIQEYFSVEYKVDPAIRTEQDAIDFIRPYFEHAVRRQLVSDVPLGAFLSGGIDSSTIVAHIQKLSRESVKTFTVRFEEASYDESGIAREVARQLGTDHHEITIPNREFTEEIFNTIIDHVGFPFRDSSAIPTYFISKEIRKYVTVALSGDGGDELFGGYTLFQWWLKVLQLKKLPHALRRTGFRVLETSSDLPFLNKLSILRKGKRALKSSFYEENEIPVELHEITADRVIPTVFKNGMNGLSNFVYPLLTDYPERANRWTPLRKIMYYRLKHTLSTNMLVKVDRMSMANSLEVRAPFLDPDLFEASAKLPDRFLINRNKGKYIIRKMMKGKLPDIVFNHPKTGFGIPLYKYQNTVYRELCNRLFTSRHPLSEVLSLEYIDKIKHIGLNTQSNNAHLSTYKASHQLWAMLQLFGWFERFKVDLE